MINWKFLEIKVGFEKGSQILNFLLQNHVSFENDSDFPKGL